jgi:hypothetical protein
MLAALRAGFPVHVIATMCGLERRKVYAWTDAAQPEGEKLQRLRLLYEIFGVETPEALRQFYRVWRSRYLHDGTGPSLNELTSAAELDSELIRQAVAACRPAVERHMARQARRKLDVKGGSLTCFDDMPWTSCEREV